MSARRLDRTRLANLLGMLGSAHDGEVVNAGRLADKLLRETGATWHEVLGAANDPRQDEGPSPDGWRGLCDACLRRPLALTRWEHDFLETLLGFRRPSSRQLDVLFRIATKVGLAGRTAA